MSSFPGQRATVSVLLITILRAVQARKPNFDRFEICGKLECNSRKGYVIWRIISNVTGQQTGFWAHIFIIINKTTTKPNR